MYCAACHEKLVWDQTLGGYTCPRNGRDGGMRCPLSHLSGKKGVAP